MDTYGESVLDIENNIPQNEYYEYILAGGRDMLEKVKQESLEQQNTSPAGDIEEIEKEEEEKPSTASKTETTKVSQNNEKKSTKDYSIIKNSSQIKQIKTTLSDLGYYQGEINHQMTPGLAKAINDFAQDNQVNEQNPNERLAQITKKLKSIKSPARLDFDGKYLRWIENNEVKLQINAMSGKPNYQNRKYQNIKDKGPLPEGKYRVKQNQIQDIDNTILEQIGRGKAPGGRDSWGYSRVWLQPFSSNEMYNRNKLTIHGGKEYGSAGCIDLEKNDRLFFNMLRKYGKDIILNVHYDKEKLR